MSSPTFVSGGEPTFTVSKDTSTGFWYKSPNQPELVVNGEPSELIKFQPNAIMFKQPVHIERDVYVNGELLDLKALNSLAKKPIITLMEGKTEIGMLDLRFMQFYGKIQGDQHNTTVCIFDSWLTATIVITWMIKHVVMWVKEKYELGKKIQEMEERYK